MEQLLQKQIVSVGRCVLDCQEDCPVTADYTLPDYCPDIAVVLKCMVTPRVQNRQWSGEQLLLDGVAEIRVLYLDEERRCVRETEFSQPLSCSLNARGRVDTALVALSLSPKYVNCRAVGPRRLEVRGAVTVCARAECASEAEVMVAQEGSGLYTRCEPITVTAPVTMAEKLFTVSETLDFPETQPAAELLLGGECRAIVRECKLLNGKAIVKGDLFIHQLYTDSSETGSTYCLDYTVPYSQILDVDNAHEGQTCTANILLLSDTQRLAVGPSGETTVLEFTAKLLVQLQVHSGTSVPLLLDAYHSRCPVTLECKEQSFCAQLGSRWETTTLPMQLDLPAGPLEALVDVWVQPQGLLGECHQGSARLSGRLLICMLVRDGDGQIAYYERPEEYQLEYGCPGNRIDAQATVTQLRYRVSDGKLELQVSLHVALQPMQWTDKKTVCGAGLCKDTPYPPQRASVLLYYAQAGEELWEIGRSCHTSPERIREENALSGDRLSQPAVLVVPL
ncbi:MAG: DUF3794 domain-containing protein [Clostridia bacterium]|nr:DUF3794 domain-containing protein [Clostridia bacterium]